VPEQELLWGIILLAAALALLLLEVFVPSMGIISIVGMGLGITGLVMLFRYDTITGFIGLAVMLVLGPMVVVFGMKVFPHTPVGRALIYGGKTEEQLEQEAAAKQAEADKTLALVGMEGEALSPLRPVGAVRIAGARYDALSELGMIPAGAKVKVTSVNGGQIKVRELR